MKLGPEIHSLISTIFDLINDNLWLPCFKRCVTKDFHFKWQYFIYLIMARLTRRSSFFSHCPKVRDFQLRRIHYLAMVIIFGIGLSILMMSYQVSVDSPRSDTANTVTMHINSMRSFQELRDKVISSQTPNRIASTTSTAHPTHHPTAPTAPPTHHPSTPDTTATTEDPTKSPMQKPTKSPDVSSDGVRASPSSPDDPPSGHTLKHDDTWTVDWELAASPFNLTAENVSDAVRWKDRHYNGSCRTQIYPILTDAKGFEYLWVHDVMSIEGGTKVWIFAVDPSAVFQRDLGTSLWRGDSN